MNEKNRVCKLCQSSKLILKFSKSLLDGKIITDYYECLKCGLLQSYHLDDASPDTLLDLYNAVEDLDTGAAWRQYVTATRIRQLVSVKLLDYNKIGRVLEFGSGSGYLINLLRHLYGWNVIGYDPYTRPYYSDQCIFKEWQDVLDRGPFDLIIATEVFEHFVNPRDEITRLGEILNKNKSIIYITTGLYESEYTDSSWKYLVPKSAQHVSFYSKKSHQYILSMFGGGQLSKVGANYEWLYCIDEKRNPLYLHLQSLKAFIIFVLVLLGLSPKIE